MYRPFDISVKKGEINKRGDKRKGETIMQMGRHIKRGRYKQIEKEKTKGEKTTQRAETRDIR